MRPHLLPALLSASVIALAGCGGDDDNGDSEPGGSDATPAETILEDAGLEICGEAQDQVAQSIGEEGVQNVRAFAVAEDCGGRTTSPNLVTVYQFSSIETRDAAARAIGAAYDGAVVLTSGALVIVASGPEAQANGDAVGQAYTDSTGAPVTTV